MYKGATRMRTVDISVDGIFAVTWTSSGTTSDFETIDMSGYAGQDITITGVLDDSEWISIVEVRQDRILAGVHFVSRPRQIRENLLRKRAWCRE